MNNDFPAISILIPSYNHEKYIEQCLNSILEENYPNKEIVIIDDGSTDKTPEIIEQWAEKNKDIIKVIFKKRENKGVPKTVNELIDLSTGEYLVLFSSDDYLLKGGLFARYNYLKENPHKMAVFGDCTVVDENNNKIYDSGIFQLYKRKKQNYLNDKGLRKEIFLYFSLPGPVLMVKKEIYNVIGKYDKSILYEDFDFYLKTVSENLLGFVDFSVSAYRKHESNTCGNKEFILKATPSHLRLLFKNYNLFNGFRFLYFKKILSVIVLGIYLRLYIFLKNAKLKFFFNILIISKNIIIGKNLKEGL